MPYRLIIIPEGFNLHVYSKRTQIAFTADFLRCVEKVKIYKYILIPFKAIKIYLFTSLLGECCPLTVVTNGFSFLFRYNPNTFRILIGISHSIASQAIYQNRTLEFCALIS